MMSTTFESRRLPATFTFRIVEAVKRIKIQPIPRVAGLPWGLSLAAGIMVAVMTIGSQMAIYQKLTPLMFSSETETLKIREMSVDILGAPGTSAVAGKQGDIDGAGMDQRSPQSNFFLAPAKGGGTWTQKADMPTARYIPGSAVVDGKIYVIGGRPVWASLTEVVEEYDPETDTWMTRANMPTARQGVAAAAVDGIIYAIGGWESSADDDWASAVEAYDPATDTWTKKADMPTARYSAGACVVDGRIYVSGGKTKFGGGPESSVPTVEVYDPATDTWTQASDMPWTRAHHSASVVDGKMYIIGGPRGTPGAGAYMSPVVDVYDPATDTWTMAADLPTPRWHLTSNVVDGKIYTIGGRLVKKLILQFAL